jgi:hypothetical protein
VEDRAWIPAGTDVNRASPARVYDVHLGGWHNFPADRWSAMRAVDDYPLSSATVLANRAFLQRAVRYLLGAGVRQFLDLGSGIPTGGHVHEVAHGVDPAVPVVYVDSDPVAAAHGDALLAGTESAAMIRADLHDVPLVLGAPAVRRLLDLTRPVGVLAVDVLQALSDDDDPAGVVGRYRDAVPTGSHLAISHPIADGGDPRPGVGRRRDRDAITSMFAGWELLPPGVVPVTSWSVGAYDGVEDDQGRIAYLAGVAKKPDGR